MDDLKNSTDLAFMLGRIQGDVKNILEALTRNQRQFAIMDGRMTKLDERLDKVEKFNVKVGVILAIASPILFLALQVGLKFIGL